MMSPRRFAQVIHLKPEKKDYYLKLHAEAWPCVLEKIRECNIRNYSIYLFKDTLFAYFEYVGKDYKADMKRMAEDPCTQRWWEETAPCQESVSEDPEDWWLDIREVFHAD